jgi:hypothetical protein
VTEDFIARLILSRAVPRELLVDILRADAKYDPASPVAGAHAAHIRALRLRRRRSEQKSRSTHPPSLRVPTAVAMDAEEFDSSDPWSRRVPTVVVDADELQSLREQVQKLQRLSDEVTRMRERLDEAERTRVA